RYYVERFCNVVERDQVLVWQTDPNRLDQFRKLIGICRGVELVFISAEPVYSVTPDHIMTFAAALAPHRRIQAYTSARIAVEAPCRARARIKIDWKQLA